VQTIDWIVLALYFLVLVGIGTWSLRQCLSAQRSRCRNRKAPSRGGNIATHMD
jgi:hypothetical protein